MMDQGEPGRDQHEHACRAKWLVDEVGRYLAGDDAGDDAVASAGRMAVTQGATQVNELLRSAFAAHEIVATELRLVGPNRGARRTLFADQPTPVALLLLCLRLCDLGDEVEVVHHTAGKGTTSRAAQWPFGMEKAEELTRPPDRETAGLPSFGEPT
ncbi:MAG TPA: hypothetical protein VGO78_09915 [Acidimicrobiales bacterium]|jgi:hypothetical protein|nr:hypothetical protein [Acidimicrobiales bacterium]